MSRKKSTITFDVNTTPGAAHKMNVKFTPEPTTPEQKEAAQVITAHFQKMFKEALTND